MISAKWKRRISKCPNLSPAPLLIVLVLRRVRKAKEYRRLVGWMRSHHSMQHTRCTCTWKHIENAQEPRMFGLLIIGGRVPPDRQRAARYFAVLYSNNRCQDNGVLPDEWSPGRSWRTPHPACDQLEVLCFLLISQKDSLSARQRAGNIGVRSARHFKG